MYFSAAEAELPVLLEVSGLSDTGFSGSLGAAAGAAAFGVCGGDICASSAFATLAGAGGGTYGMPISPSCAMIDDFSAGGSVAATAGAGIATLAAAAGGADTGGTGLVIDPVSISPIAREDEAAGAGAALVVQAVPGCGEGCGVAGAAARAATGAASLEIDPVTISPVARGAGGAGAGVDALVVHAGVVCGGGDAFAVTGCAGEACTGRATCAGCAGSAGCVRSATCGLAGGAGRASAGASLGLSTTGFTGVALLTVVAAFSASALRCAASTASAAGSLLSQSAALASLIASAGWPAA